MATRIDLAHLQQWIGRSVAAKDAVTLRLVEAYQATLAPYLFAPAGEAAPLGLHWCLAPAVVPLAALGPDGHAVKGGFLPPVPLPRRMWAGGTVEILDALHVGESILRQSTVTDIAVKEGRSGTLCFVTLRHEISGDRGPAVRERQDIVFLGGTPAERSEPDDPSPPQEAGPAELSWTVDPTPVLLFRYSALTFNGHRIHYDHPYAREVEGYPGLVVHGPLLATLLLNLAATVAGRAPARFTYRGTAPLFAGRPFRVAGVRAATGAIACRIEDANGRIAMRGMAE